MNFSLYLVGLDIFASVINARSGSKMANKIRKFFSERLFQGQHSSGNKRTASQPASVVGTKRFDAWRELMSGIQEINLAACSDRYPVFADSYAHDLVETVEGERQFACMTSDSEQLTRLVG